MAATPIDPTAPAGKHVDMMALYHYVCDSQLPHPSAEAFAMWLASDWIDFVEGPRATARTHGEAIGYALRYWRGDDL